jgi:hypothetical protein
MKRTSAGLFFLIPAFCVARALASFRWEAEPQDAKAQHAEWLKRLDASRPAVVWTPPPSPNVGMALETKRGEMELCRRAFHEESAKLYALMKDATDEEREALHNLMDQQRELLWTEVRRLHDEALSERSAGVRNTP